MAISHTMSNPNDWMFQHNYQTSNFSPLLHPEFPPQSNAYPDVTAAAPRPAALIPDQGRVAKPARKRSRASRRTPTTLLNTDTANFRAMVQHFTGGPAAPFAGRPQVGPPAGGFHVEYPGGLMLPLQQQQHGFVMHGGGEAAPGSGNGGYMAG